MYNLKIITSTVRPGRKGPVVAEWIADKARKNGSFNVEILDLGEINLPLMNEPNHPRFKNYIYEHTKNWSAKIDEADAFIFVTAEYDHSYPAPLKNALEYLMSEWAYKAAGVVSYGGVSAGTRAAHMLSGDLASLKMVPLFESINFPFFFQNFNEKGEFTVNEVSDKAADAMLSELVRWTQGLKIVRENNYSEYISKKAI